MAWCFQRGIVSIVKSQHHDQLEEYYHALDLTLSEDEVESIYQVSDTE